MDIVILHGWGQSKDDWESLANKLGKRAVAFNMPGFGGEKLIGNDWGVPEYADWVEKKIGKRRNLVIVGHSFGGRVALEIAARQPKNLKGLVLSGAPVVYRPGFGLVLKIYIYKLARNFLPEKIKRLFYSGDLKGAMKIGMEKVFRNVVNYDQTESLQKIKVPVLLIWGEDDEEVPIGIAKEMEMLIKRSRLRVIENSGHNSFFDNPNLFYGYVKEFIENV